MKVEIEDMVNKYEHSLQTTFKKDVYSKFVKAIKEFNLVEENDNIMVCISGGKDSSILALCLRILQRYSDFPFNVQYVVMDPGYSPFTLKKIHENLKELDIDAHIYESHIFEEINADVDDKPCFRCAKKRRGHLYAKAKELGCNKIALGHHFDDVVETNMMNILYTGRIRTMMPKLKSINFEGLELIRPLYLVREKDVIRWANFNEIDFIKCGCVVTIKNLDSKRKYVKNMLKDLDKDNEFALINIFKSMYNVNLNKVISYEKEGNEVHFLDEY